MTVAILLASACSSEQATTNELAPVDFSEAMANAQGEIADIAETCMAQRGFASVASVEDLSPAEGEAYLNALNGDAAEPGPEELGVADAAALAADVFETRFDVRFGCRALAEFAVQARIVGIDSTDEAITLEELVSSDPTIVKLQLDWSRCMREAGFEVADQDEVEDLVAQANGNLSSTDEARVGSDDEPPPELLAGSEQAVSMSDFEVEIRDASTRCWAPIEAQANSRIAEILADQ